MQSFDLIFQILALLLTLFIAAISWFLLELYKKQNKHDDSINQIKLNYLDRFNAINSKLESIHIDIALIKNDLNKIPNS
jgi:hypothetical protein